MIHKNEETQHGAVRHSAEVSHLDNGQTVIKIHSTLGAFNHQHSVTVGSEDGRDLTQADDDTLLAGLQKHLDDTRASIANVLTARARIHKLTDQLK